jgi:hypothetical protein
MANHPPPHASHAVEAKDAAHPSRLVWIVVLLGALFSLSGVVNRDSTGSSALWFLDPLLYAVLIGGMVLRSRGRLPVWRPMRPGIGAAAYVGLSWLTAMLYELSLRSGATGFGGLHPDTATSFPLAQGYYLPLAVGSYWLLRRFHYDFNTVFWTGCLASLYEAVTVGGAVVVGGGVPLLLLPVLVGYYLTTYAMFLIMPLLIIDESGLWSPGGRKISPWLVGVLGILFGLVLWVIYTVWALLLGIS